jgi:hypothetical protein
MYYRDMAEADGPTQVRRSTGRYFPNPPATSHLTVAPPHQQHQQHQEHPQQQQQQRQQLVVRPLLAAS